MRCLVRICVLALAPLAAGCPKPAPAKPSTTAKAPAPKPAPAASGGPAAATTTGVAEAFEEAPRDNPRYVAVREVFSRAKRSFSEGRFSDLYETIEPASRDEILARIVRFALDSAGRDSRPKLFEILARQKPDSTAPATAETDPLKIPVSTLIDVPDRRRLFADLLRWCARSEKEAPAFDTTFAGEPRVGLYELGDNRVPIKVSLPDRAPDAKSPACLAVKVGETWYLRFP